MIFATAVDVMATDRPHPLDAELEELRAIADAAWRVREVLCLNLLQLVRAGDPAAKNVVDALNDLCEVLPLAEDGRTWERARGV